MQGHGCTTCATPELEKPLRARAQARRLSRRGQGSPVNGKDQSTPSSDILRGLLGSDLVGLIFRVHLGLGGVKDGLLRYHASPDLGA